MTKPNQRIKARLLFRLGKSSFGKWVDEKHLSGVDGEMVWWFVTGAESVTGSVIALLSIGKRRSAAKSDYNRLQGYLEAL